MENATRKISDLIEMLKKTHKSSMLSFYYKNDDELLKAQSLMI